MLGRKGTQAVLLAALSSCFKFARAIPVPEAAPVSEAVRTPVRPEPYGAIGVWRVGSPRKPPVPEQVLSCKSVDGDPTTMVCSKRPAPRSQWPTKRNIAARIDHLDGIGGTRLDGSGGGLSTKDLPEALTVDMSDYQDAESKDSQRPDRTPMHQEPEEPERRPGHCQSKTFSTDGKPRKNAKTCPTDQPSQWYRFADSAGSAPAPKNSPTLPGKPKRSYAKRDHPRYLPDGSDVTEDERKVSERSTTTSRRPPPGDKWHKPCDGPSASMETGPPHRARHRCDVDDFWRGPREAGGRAESRAVWEDPNVLHQPPSKHVLPIDRAKRRAFDPSADVSKPFMRDAHLGRRAPAIDNEQYYDEEGRRIPFTRPEPAPQRNLQEPHDRTYANKSLANRQPLFPPAALSQPKSNPPPSEARAPRKEDVWSGSENIRPRNKEGDYERSRRGIGRTDDPLTLTNRMGKRGLAHKPGCPGCGLPVNAKHPPPCDLEGRHRHFCYLAKRDNGLEEGQWNPGGHASDDGGEGAPEANREQVEGDGEDQAQGAEAETSDDSEGDRTSATTAWIAPEDGSSATGACGVDYNAGSHGACVSPELSERCGKKIFAYTGDDGKAPKASTLLTVVDTCDELGSDGLWVTKDAYDDLGGGDGGEVQNVNWKFVDDGEVTNEGDKTIQKGEQQEEEKETGGPAPEDHASRETPQSAKIPTEAKAEPPADSRTPVPPHTSLPSPSEPQPPADTGNEGHESHEGQPGMLPLGHDAPVPTPAKGSAPPQASEDPKPSKEIPSVGEGGADDDLGLGLTRPEDTGASTQTEAPGEADESSARPSTPGEHPPSHEDTPSAGGIVEGSVGTNGEQSNGAGPGSKGDGGGGDHAGHEGHHMP